MKNLKEMDVEIYNSLQNELKRQQYGLELIASENFVSEAVLEAVGSVAINKYAEGYPNKRYYGGCEYVDNIELLAIERAKKLFNVNYVNVQPHSGSSANMGAYRVLLKKGDTVLGMNLSHGGHLTHGSPVNFSGIDYKFVAYGVDKITERIDYEEVRKLAIEHKPKLIVAGASAYSRIIDFEKFKDIADEVGAYFMVDMAHIAGLVATGMHPSPIPYADIVTTTTHKTLRGARGGMILTNNEELAKKIDKVIFPSIQGGGLMNMVAGKAVTFKEALEPSFIDYQRQVLDNARVLAWTLEENGIRIVSGGTDNHLMLLDLTDLEITGKEAEARLSKNDITVNKNGIPFDTKSPFITSGIRIGTPALTTRGMKEQEMVQIGYMIARVLKEDIDIREEVKALVEKFPLYTEVSNG